MEEATGFGQSRAARQRLDCVYVPVLNSVQLAVHDLLNILVGKELQDQGHVVRVKQQLCQIFCFQDICAKKVSRLVCDRQTMKSLTRKPEPFQKQ